MSIEKAIEIAKKIDPAIGPSLDMDKKNLSEAQLKIKLKDFFVANKKAADLMIAHPGKTPDELKDMVEINITAHVNNDFHIATFVTSVLGKKSDLDSLALSTSRRIVLSDPRIPEYFKQNPGVDKAKISQELSEKIKQALIDYFSNLKGKNIDQGAIVDELTTNVTKGIAKTLESIGKAA